MDKVVHYCRVTEKDSELRVIRTLNFPIDLEANGEGLVDLVKRKKILCLEPACWASGEIKVLRHNGEKFLIDSQLIEESELGHYLLKLAESSSFIVSDCMPAQSVILVGESSSNTSQELNEIADEDSKVQLRFFIGKDLSGEIRLLDVVVLDQGDNERFIKKGKNQSLTSAHQIVQFEKQIFSSGYHYDFDEGFAKNHDGFDADTVPRRNIKESISKIIEGLSSPKYRFYFISIDVSVSENDFKILDVQRTPKPQRNSKLGDFYRAHRVIK